MPGGGEALGTARDGQPGRDADGQAGIRAALTPPRRKENPEYIGFVKRAVAGAAARVVDQADIEGLGELIALADTVDDEVRAAITGLRNRWGMSWARIGQAAGTTPQSAHERWRQRDPLAARALYEAIRDLHVKAARPTTREVAKAAGIGHTTVGEVLRGMRVPSWQITAAIVTALGGDPAGIRPLWEEAAR